MHRSYRGGNKKLNSLAVNQKTRLEMQAGARTLNRLQAFAKWYDPICDWVHIPLRDGSTKDGRARALWDWIHTYDIDLTMYYQTETIVVTVAGVTFSDRKEDFPSELLFANVAMAVKSGAVEKRR